MKAKTNHMNRRRFNTNRSRSWELQKQKVFVKQTFQKGAGGAGGPCKVSGGVDSQMAEQFLDVTVSIN